MNAVVDWFGAAFGSLHPKLQELHQNGGVLRGTVVISFGAGLAGVLGRRLASKLGLPEQPGPCPMTVQIDHAHGALQWSRQFGMGRTMNSTFTPVGRYPDGHWLERTGPLTLVLGVDMSGGGWRWLPRQIRCFGIRLPRWLLPASDAYKRIEDDDYVFSVAFRLLGVGELLCYRGTLKAQKFAAEPTGFG